MWVGKIKENYKMEKLTAFQIWKKAKDEKLSDADYKNLLLENGVIIKIPRDVCENCFGSGVINYGGSFGGASMTMPCECRKK